MTGSAQLDLLAEIGPMRRDLVSTGYDHAMGLLAQRFPALEIGLWPSGTEAWGWPIPDGWTFQGGSIRSESGDFAIDLAEHCLRVGSYSMPVDGHLSRDELLQHVKTHPHLPDALPFAFHYYADRWSVGLTALERDSLPDERFHVTIRSERAPSNLAIGEWLLVGDSEAEFVLSTHLCHPGQVSDGLSGVVTGLAVMQQLAAMPRRRFSYRLLIGPETIGAIAWLSRNEDRIGSIAGGLFLEMTGVDQPAALQHAFDSDCWMDRALTAGFESAERDSWQAPHRQIVGNDERQFNAPGVRIPMLSLSRAIPRSDPHAPFQAYHSSEDTVELVSEERLEQSARTVMTMLNVIESDYIPVGHFKGEPFLSGVGIPNDDPALLLPHRQRLMVLDYLDGTLPVSDIARTLALPFNLVLLFVDRLVDAGLVSRKMSLPS